jgi:hypothetical protein
MLFSYFNKCLLDYALDVWWSVMLHNDDPTIKSFKFSLKEWVINLLPDNKFLAKKEWMTHTMKKPYTIKVKDFGNSLEVLNCYSTKMPHDDKVDTVITDTNLKATSGIQN